MKKQNKIKKPDKKSELSQAENKGGCVVIPFPHVPVFDIWCKKDRLGGAA